MIKSSVSAAVLVTALAVTSSSVQAQPKADSACAPPKHHSIPLQRVGKADGFECHDPDGPAPSFDCGKAASTVEKAICASEQLRKKDCLIKYVYYDALNAAADSCAQEGIRTSQRNWVAGREDSCAANQDVTDCIAKAYASRAGDLIAQYKLRSDVYSLEDFMPPSAPVVMSSQAPQKVSISTVSPSVRTEPIVATVDSKRMDWEDLVRKQWDLILAVYVMLLGAIAWRDQRPFDSRWKAVVSKIALFTLALPLTLILLVLKGIWRFRREILGSMLGGGAASSRASAPSAQSTSLQIDETVNIEIQDAGGGSWKKMMTAPNNPDSISIAFRNVLQNPSIKKVRAVGSKTGQLYDFAG